MKVCGSCREEKQFEEFNKNKTKHDGLQTSCKKCEKAYKVEWYEKNKEQHKKNVAVNRDAARLEVRQKLYDYYSSHPCVDCHEADPIVLELDHVRGTKRKNVARMVGNCCSWTAILVEIAKCEVRCANCHKRRTAIQMGWYRGLVT